MTFTLTDGRPFPRGTEGFEPAVLATHPLGASCRVDFDRGWIGDVFFPRGKRAGRILGAKRSLYNGAVWLAVEVRAPKTRAAIVLDMCNPECVHVAADA